MGYREEVKYKFTVKEDDRSNVWLMCEPQTKELTIVGEQGFLSLNLKPNCSYLEAQNIAQYLNKNIENISYSSIK